MPLVSIVMPAFEAGRFIGRAVESVRRQTHKDWELIVIEDGSHDETASIVNQFADNTDQKVTYQNNGTNSGVSATRNRGFQQARGEIIAFLDADDSWTPDHLLHGVKALERGADISYSGFHLYDEATQTSKLAAEPTAAQLETPLTRLFTANFIQSSSLVMLKRAVVTATGKFDAELKVGEDCDYWLRAIGLGFKLTYTGHASCFYAKHSSSAMSKTLMVAEHTAKFYQKHLQSAFLPRSLRRERYANSLLQWGRLIRSSNPRLARSLFLQAWKIQPLNWTCPIYVLASLGSAGKTARQAMALHGNHAA